MYKYKLIIISDIVEDTNKLNSLLGQGYHIQNSYVVNGNSAFYICKYFNQQRNVGRDSSETIGGLNLIEPELFSNNATFAVRG